MWILDRICLFMPSKNIPAGKVFVLIIYKMLEYKKKKNCKNKKCPPNILLSFSFAQV